MNAPATTPLVFDPLKVWANTASVATRGQKLIQELMSRAPEPALLGMSEFRALGTAFTELTAKLISDPMTIAMTTTDLWAKYALVWQQMGQQVLFPSTKPKRLSRDHRFKDKAWTENAIFEFIKETYLISAESILETVRNVKGLDPKAAHKVNFYMKQFVDAIAPSNFIGTNPEVLRAIVETGGDNLVRGLSNLLDDLVRGKGRLAITMTDTSAFRLGENVAATPGKVIAQNDLMQLIQYASLTSEVKKRPLLIVPPWINKFYVLDLRPGNSFIRWAVAQGHTVFVISWVNPDERLAKKAFEDYMLEGTLAALTFIEQAVGELEVNAIGYCLGGTLLASTLAYLSAKSDDRIRSATYFVTLVDFTDVGDIAVFIDERQLASLEKRMQKRGYLDASDMTTSFNMLRANDLIWPFVVNNYLLGKEPIPFDLLYWNSDATRMPAAMHSFYLRNMYHENRLVKPGGISLGGVPIDLHRIRTPSFLLSTREDHIAPWRSTYAATQIYSAPVKFVLSESGHIAGVINPPGSKYGHCQNDELPKTADEWLEKAVFVPGSWWPAWDKWVSQFAGGTVAARDPGAGRLRAIEDAPGSHVRVRAT